MMRRRLTDQLRQYFFPSEDHPFQHFLAEIRSWVQPGDTVLDAGCGRSAPVLRSLPVSIGRAIGIDVNDFDQMPETKLLLLRSDVTEIALRDSSVDLVFSRSVLEHVAEPYRFYQEVHRVLKVGGRFVFLTPNLWDYASLLSKAIPNNWHPRIVRWCEGRPEEDTFPVYYRSNTERAIGKLARQSGFSLEKLRRLGQYPCYLMFNPALFLIGTAYEKIITQFKSLAALRGWLLVVLMKSE